MLGSGISSSSIFDILSITSQLKPGAHNDLGIIRNSANKQQLITNQLITKRHILNKS